MPLTGLPTASASACVQTLAAQPALVPGGTPDGQMATLHAILGRLHERLEHAAREAETITFKATGRDLSSAEAKQGPDLPPGPLPLTLFAADQMHGLVGRIETALAVLRAETTY